MTLKKVVWMNWNSFLVTHSIWETIKWSHKINIKHNCLLEKIQSNQKLYLHWWISPDGKWTAQWKFQSSNFMLKSPWVVMIPTESSYRMFRKVPLFSNVDRPRWESCHSQHYINNLVISIFLDHFIFEFWELWSSFHPKILIRLNLKFWNLIILRSHEEQCLPWFSQVLKKAKFPS